MNLNSKHANRVIKVHVARAPQAYEEPSPLATNAADTVAPTPSPSQSTQPVGLPTSTAALAGIVTFLLLALLLVLGACIYRRQKMTKRKPKVPFDFDRNAFGPENKEPAFEQPIRTPLRDYAYDKSQSPRYQESVASRDSGETSTVATAPKPVAQNPNPNYKLRVANNCDSAPTVPKAVADNRRPSRAKFWLNPLNVNPEDAVHSPPPSYDIANGGKEFLVPIPSQLPPSKSRIPPTPPTPPANKKSRAKKPQTLRVPDQKTAIASFSPSPSRCESFAAKGLMPYSTSPTSVAGPSSSTRQSKNPFASPNEEVNFKAPPKLMNVIAPFNPTLSDELKIQVGDTVQLYEEYEDGWCFIQYVGNADSPKGVIPLLCLEERKKIVPHKPSAAPRA